MDAERHVWTLLLHRTLPSSLAAVIPFAFLRPFLPLACAWAAAQERNITRDGVALTPGQVADARRIGVAKPEQVRLRVADKVPPSLSWVLERLAKPTGLVSEHTIGMTLRYGIFIRADHWGERRLLVHELAHTAQYERLGGFRPFLEVYLAECFTPPGYPFGALEEEAKRIEQEICGTAR
jgi:hypothetical protein